MTIGDEEKLISDLDSMGRIIYDFTMQFEKIETLYILSTSILLPTHKPVWEESEKNSMYTKNINSHISPNA